MIQTRKQKIYDAIVIGSGAAADQRMLNFPRNSSAKKARPINSIGKAKTFSLTGFCDCPSPGSSGAKCL
jgi:hypothetical protein